MKATTITSLGLLCGLSATSRADDHAMMEGLNGFSTTPIFSVGEHFEGYFPPGILDGMFAYDRGENVYLLVTHE